MHTKSLLAAALAALAASLPATQATWCQYFTDPYCLNPANGGTTFDCANTHVFGSSGIYAQCSSTKTNQRTCVISRCSDSMCNSPVTTLNVSPYGGKGPCVNMGGAGPWYRQRFA